jgi:hypothetical protein
MGAADAVPVAAERDLSMVWRTGRRPNVPARNRIDLSTLHRELKCRAIRIQDWNHDGYNTTPSKAEAERSNPTVPTTVQSRKIPRRRALQREYSPALSVATPYDQIQPLGLPAAARSEPVRHQGAL